MTGGGIAGVVFDKDGTLFDFRATWDVWAAGVLADLSEGDAQVLVRLADAAQFDLESRSFRPESAIIAGTHREAAEILASALPGADVDRLERDLAEKASRAPLAPAADLPSVLGGLRARGLRLAVMTNDAESVARAHLGAVGVLDRFDMIAGFDSGFGAKPDPGPLWACADRMAVPPERCVMVGDSTHDLQAGRAAGMRCVGVLTGPAGRADLAPLADAVLTDIGALPGWLDSMA
ncbi:HAD family hydrolase [Aestuariicoccus sp. MJ-SS9]|uniref:HAD family hydrolase n=1 Tax=Aestuariicoccus sp. MJ-SS9 TaxID=3079855 RepID=UPI00292D319D|nr:HAD family hydrolase [Aestuariicoccus sp. MJ-SS9]